MDMKKARSLSDAELDEALRDAKQDLWGARFALSTVRRNAMTFLRRPEAQALLDEAWNAEELSGCSLLSTEALPRDVWPDLKIVRAYDPMTTLNVLGRCRGGILVAPEAGWHGVLTTVREVLNGRRPEPCRPVADIATRVRHAALAHVALYRELGVL